MTRTDLATATATHMAQFPRSAYAGPREILADAVVPAGASAKDRKFNAYEQDAVRAMRLADTGTPGDDLPVNWCGDLAQAYRIVTRSEDSLRDQYRVLVGRRAPKSYSALKLAVVVWRLNAVAADKTARLSVSR